MFIRDLSDSLQLFLLQLNHAKETNSVSSETKHLLTQTLANLPGVPEPLFPAISDLIQEGEYDKAMLKLYCSYDSISCEVETAVENLAELGIDIDASALASVETE